ncbi:hypothetical protein HID58_087516 [Brassica napus]|uniref:Uncharacterized protein n=1 Tax=Brassica napus TaxID=3708 RepID=A0ABQ7XTI2_BRANA|nr:hypothetical protein HID58_087516 [Brassica napus]
MLRKKKRYFKLLELQEQGIKMLLMLMWLEYLLTPKRQELVLERFTSSGSIPSTYISMVMELAPSKQKGAPKQVINLLFPKRLDVSSTLSHNIQKEYRDVVERRVFTVLDNGSYSQLADEEART